MNYNEYLKIVGNEIFAEKKELMNDTAVKRLLNMLYSHIAEIENVNYMKYALKDLIRNN